MVRWIRCVRRECANVRWHVKLSICAGSNSCRGHRISGIGIEPAAIKSLAVLVSNENFKRIMRRRYEIAGRRENVFNSDLAIALLQIAREWVQVKPTALAELKRLVSMVPMPTPGLTLKKQDVLSASSMIQRCCGACTTSRVACGPK